MSEKSSTNYIFFLKSTDELNPFYFQIADSFRQLNIVLLPISSEELKIVDRHKKHQIIIFRNDFTSAQIFSEIRKSYLDFAMSRGHVCVYDISSFSEHENSTKYQTQKSYFYFPLPIDVKQFVMRVAIEYFRTKREIEDWPGGRRSKLPVTTKYENKNQ
jgi:hypothetical protein